MPSVYVSGTGTSAITLINAPANPKQSIVITAILITGDGTASGLIADTSGTPVNLTGCKFVAGGGFCWANPNSLMVASPGTGVTLTLSSSINIIGHIEYMLKGG